MLFNGKKNNLYKIATLICAWFGFSLHAFAPKPEYKPTFGQLFKSYYQFYTSPDCRHFPMDRERRALYAAIKNGEVYPEANFQTGPQPLVAAIEHQDIEMIKLLLNHGGSATLNRLEPPYSTALCCALYSSNEINYFNRSKIFRLLSNAGAHVNADNGFALQIAVEKGDDALMRWCNCV